MENGCKDFKHYVKTSYLVFNITKIVGIIIEII